MDKNRDHFLIDLKTGQFKEPDPANREALVWGDIAEAFSNPVAMDEPHSDYVPTQILGEAFRHCGYDGIVYRSFLDPKGYNVALFDLALAELMNLRLFKTKSLNYEFD